MLQTNSLPHDVDQYLLSLLEKELPATPEQKNKEKNGNNDAVLYASFNARAKKNTNSR